MVKAFDCGPNIKSWYLVWQSQTLARHTHGETTWYPPLAPLSIAARLINTLNYFTAPGLHCRIYHYTYSAVHTIIHYTVRLQIATEDGPPGRTTSHSRTYTSTLSCMVLSSRLTPTGARFDNSSYSFFSRFWYAMFTTSDLITRGTS